MSQLTYKVLDNERQAIRGGWEVSKWGCEEGTDGVGAEGGQSRRMAGTRGAMLVLTAATKCWIMRGRLRDKRMGGERQESHLICWEDGQAGGGGRAKRERACQLQGVMCWIMRGRPLQEDGRWAYGVLWFWKGCV